MKAMLLRFGKTHRRVIGGPYRNKPTEHLGVKMAAEINAPCFVSVPTRDFSTPRREDVEAAVRKLFLPLALGEPIYVGCMGGIGRTGLFLAILTKVFEPSVDPVVYVRRYYLSHAVETSEQREWVSRFDVSQLCREARPYLWLAKVVDLFPFVKNLTKRIFKL